MHWLQQNWLLVLGWTLYVISDSLPFLPGKAQGVAQFLLGIGRAIAKGGGKIPPAVALLLVGALMVNGCALSTTAKGATLAQKLQDDMAAIKQIELDVKTQCGPQFAPLAVQAGAVLSIAEAAANASVGNVVGAVGNAAAAFPTVAGDVQGLACVVKVLEADYQKYKPKAAAWLKRLETPAAVAQLLALVEVPQICDSGTDGGASACRAIAIDDEMPMTLAVSDRVVNVHEARAVRVTLISR